MRQILIGLVILAGALSARAGNKITDLSASVPTSLIGSWQAIKPTSDNGGASTSLLTIKFTASQISYISDCQSQNDKKVRVQVTVGVEINSKAKTFAPTGEDRKQTNFDGGYYCYVTVDRSPSQFQLVGQSTLKVKDEGMDWVTYRKVSSK